MCQGPFRWSSLTTARISRRVRRARKTLCFHWDHTTSLLTIKWPSNSSLKITQRYCEESSNWYMTTMQWNMTKTCSWFSLRSRSASKEKNRHIKERIRDFRSVLTFLNTLKSKCNSIIACKIIHRWQLLHTWWWFLRRKACRCHHQHRQELQLRAKELTSQTSLVTSKNSLGVAAYSGSSSVALLLVNTKRIKRKTVLPSLKSIKSDLWIIF